ncbi:hypothetical protein [Rhodococcus sp. JVH1]|uniref:hypothetical protein n=1 Tax=Rhodococcus sp. JVH1 TaxID=745408 RepID=UPI00027202A5|nr:hypothetical protein [Rhodococcus sp. JVH1]EJJ00208.1 hypothetical protein JVH1_2225 [Rhodococcus sp. JVH1]
MSVLTVFLAADGPAQGVRDVLRDLSAAGLVSPFLWIDDSAVVADSTRLRARETSAGSDTAVVLQDVLASRRIDRVRICVLVAGATQVDPESVRFVSELLTSNSGGARSSRLRLLLRRPGAEDGGATTLAGWHNLLIAPEDSRGPGMGHESLAPTADPLAVGRHAAPVIAGVTGLWNDAQHAPFDDEPVLPGNALRVVRSYYRRLDTARAEHDLRSELLDFGGLMPLPHDAGTNVLYADDVASATSTMARALWRKHSALLSGERADAPGAVEPRTIRFVQALRMFFSFLFAVLRNAPAQWVARVANRASASVASATQTTLFGSSTRGAYRVVVGGVDADGHKVAWTDYEAASKQIGAMLDAAGATPQPVTPDLSALWRDYARAALTLSDASERSAGLPPVQVGAHRAILRTAADVIPGPGDRFTDIPGMVSATLSLHAVEPADILGVTETRDRLRELEQDPTIGLDARRTSSALAAWWSRKQRSFAVSFGSILTGRLEATVNESRVLLERLDTSEQRQDLAEACAEQQAHMFRRVRIATVLFLLLAVAAGVFAWREIISWWWGGPAIAVCVLAWAAVVAIVCQRTQQFLERLLVERDAAARADAADRANLRVALREIEHLTGAYRQFLSWSRALGAFLVEPLGASEQTRTTSRTVGWGLPRHTAIASGTPSPEQVERVAEALRRDLFTVGWLTDPWDTVLGSAGAALGTAGHDIDRDPGLLAAKPGAGSGSALDEWSLRFDQGTIRATGAAVLWQRALAELTGTREELAHGLLETVEFFDGGVPRRVGVDEFVAGIGTRSDGVAFFDRSIFSDTASTKGLSAVSGETVTRVRVGCGLVAVTTQYTDGLSDEDLRATHVRRADVMEMQQIPEFELRPARQTSTSHDSVARTPFVVPVVDGLNF